jgi:predicted metal-dependent HD superfamily phosphohydrolase
MEEEFNRIVNQYTHNTGLWTEVALAYTVKGRYYHTLAHLNQLLTELNPYQSQFRCWNTVVFAIAYHDFVYKSTRKDNEEKSALVAGARLRQLDFPEPETKRCVEFILATKQHESVNREIDLFTDADLAILGATPERYQIYTAEIRKEYAIYPDLLYKPGRKKVLQHFLQMKRIYKTDEFYERYELAARRNLELELKGL